MDNNKIGIIIALYKSSFIVDIDNKLEVCKISNSFKNPLVVGDTVILNKLNLIEKIIPRINLFYRSQFNKSKFIASNIDQILIITAVRPSFSLDLLNRILIEAHRSYIKSIIVLNKIDLNEFHSIINLLEIFSSLDINIVKICAHDNIDTKLKLYKILENKKSLLLGQSGMGKSTIIKTICNDSSIKTREFSEKLNTGKHTTSFVKAYKVPEINAKIIDSPGFQTFGLHHVTQEEIIKAFYEFEQFVPYCKYYNCKHIHETKCGIIDALNKKQISKFRYESYKNIMLNK